MSPRALKSFTVKARLPEPLSPLLEVAMNLRWSWDARSRDLFRWVDPRAWELARHDPIRLLSTVDLTRLEELAEDPSFMDFLSEVHRGLQRYREAPRWFQGRTNSPLKSVAYFSPEFGLSEALPQYSGGLGVLAGDHLKAATQLGIPIVGVGLFYRQGYFRQELNAEGWQQERYVDLDPHAMALQLVDGVKIKVDLAGQLVAAQVWRAEIGRVPLYLLDTDIDDNDEGGRSVTNRLYGGTEEHRLRQEILLGIGGVLALDAVGEKPQIYHTNEGHAGLLGLALLRVYMANHGLSFDEAVEAVRAGTVFTSHTPVPAGIDRFPRELAEKYFKSWADDLGIDFDEGMGLGHGPSDPPEAPFNMAVMGFKLASTANAVSALHGRVSRGMFSYLWPDIPVDEVPITAVTNGVHARTWISAEMSDLLDKYVLPQWEEADPEHWSGVEEASDDELWRAHEAGRERLVAFVRQRLRESALARGATESDVAWCDEVFDPHALTICWARRFASYKRATLILTDEERLRKMLLSEPMPVQIVFAGKAHPADDIGKEMIRRIIQFSRRDDARTRVAFIEDYDIAVARVLYQGADVWLNNPRRPLEACGTSGEKAALNGALNCSILDGWWDEMFDGQNGWAISSSEVDEDYERRDGIEAASLYDLLERQIIPLFYQKEAGVPTQWIKRMKLSLATLGPRVTAHRMLRDYVEKLYEPAALRAETLRANNFDKAKGLAHWKKRIGAEWAGVKIESVEGETGVTELGAERSAVALVRLGKLGKDDVDVQLLHGVVGANDELMTTSTVTMNLAEAQDGVYRYESSFNVEKAGRYGFTVRVVPSHPDLKTFAETSSIVWA